MADSSTAVKDKPQKETSAIDSVADKLLSTAPTVDDYLANGKEEFKRLPHTKEWAKPGFEEEARKEGTIKPEHKELYNKWYNDFIVHNPGGSNREGYDYNLPAYWNEFKAPGHPGKEELSINDSTPGTPHMTDKHKFPWEQAVSRESKYVDPTKAPYWEYKSKKTGQWQTDSMEDGTYSEARTRNEKGQIFAHEHQDTGGIDHYTPEDAPYTEDAIEKASQNLLGQDVQPPLQAEQGIMDKLQGYASNAGKAIGDYAQNMVKEAPQPGSADAMAAGVMTGGGEFAAMPFHLLGEVAKRMNPDAYNQLAEDYPPFKKLMQLGAGEISNPQINEAQQQFPASFGTGANLAPMAVPLYDFEKAGAVVAPLLKLAATHPIIAKALQATIGSAPLGAGVALNNQAMDKTKGSNPYVNVPLQTAANMAVAGLTHGAVQRIFGGVEKNVHGQIIPKEDTPLQKDAATAPAPQTQLPRLLAETPIKQNNKIIKFNHPYDLAVYYLFKKPNNKFGWRSLSWLKQNYPQLQGQYLEDGQAIEQGIKVLADEQPQATITINPGEAQTAAHRAKVAEQAEIAQKEQEKTQKQTEKENKQILKDWDKHEKEQEKLVKEQQKAEKERQAEIAKKDKEYGDAIAKREKELQAAEDKADKLHDEALNEADKAKKTQLRKEEAAAWKEYEEHKKLLDQVNDEYDKFKQGEAKLQKEQALADITPAKKTAPLKGEVRKVDIDEGDRQSQIDRTHAHEQVVDISKLDGEQLAMVRQLGKLQREENVAELKLEVAVEQTAKVLGISEKDLRTILGPKKALKASVRTDIEEQTGVQLVQESSVMQTYPHESPTLTEAERRAIISQIKENNPIAIRKLKLLYQAMMNAKKKQTAYRETPIITKNNKSKYEGKTPIEALGKTVKPGSYVELKDPKTGKITMIVHKEGKLVPDAGESAASQESHRDNLKLQKAKAAVEDNLQTHQLSVSEKVANIRKQLRGEIAKTRVTRKNREAIQHMNDVIDAVTEHKPTTVARQSRGTRKPGRSQTGHIDLSMIVDLATMAGKKGAQFFRKKQNKHTWQERLRAWHQVVRNSQIYKRYDPELMSTLADLRGHASRFEMGVKAPQTDKEWEVWLAALRPKADENDILAGEGIFGKLPEKTRTYIVQLRVFREEALAAVKASMEKHFGDEENPHFNYNVFNYTINGRIRLRAALESDIRLYSGKGTPEGPTGRFFKNRTKNVQDAFMLMNQASHFDHGVTTITNNLSEHPITSAQFVNEYIANPQFRELLSEFDFGGAVRTAYIERLEGQEQQELANSLQEQKGLWATLTKAVPADKAQQLKNLLQGSVMEKNFKLGVTRGIGFIEAAKDKEINMSVKDLTDLLLRDARGEELSPEEIVKVVRAHTLTAQYLEDTVGGSTPGMIDPTWLHHFPATKAITGFVTSKVYQRNFQLKSISSMADKVESGDFRGACGEFRRAATLQYLQIAMNGAKGVAVGTSTILGMGVLLHGEEKKQLDHEMNKWAWVANNVTHIYSPALQPQEFPIIQGLGGMIPVVVRSMDTVSKLWSGQGMHLSPNEEVQDERQSQQYKGALRAAANIAAVAGFNAFANDTVGTQIALSACFRARDAWLGLKTESHYGPLTGTTIKKEVDVETNAGKELLEFLTEGKTKEYTDMQADVEDEERAYLSLYHRGYLLKESGYKEAYEEGLKEANAADHRMITYMQKHGEHNNRPAHDIGEYDSKGFTFSWREKLDNLEAPQASWLKQAANAISKTGVTIK